MRTRPGLAAFHTFSANPLSTSLALSLMLGAYHPVSEEVSENTLVWVVAIVLITVSVILLLRLVV